MDSGSLDGGGDAEYNGVGFAESFRIYLTQTNFFFGVIPFDTTFRMLANYMSNCPPNCAHVGTADAHFSGYITNQ